MLLEHIKGAVMPAWVKYVAYLLIFVTYTAVSVKVGYDISNKQCQVDNAEIQLERAQDQVSVLETVRKGEQLFFSERQSISNDYYKKQNLDISTVDGFNILNTRLRDTVQEATRPVKCSVSKDTSIERPSQAIKALADAFDSCNREQQEMAKGYSEALNRGETCQAGYGSAERLTNPVQ
jgi:hypothetical protein